MIGALNLRRCALAAIVPFVTCSSAGAASFSATPVADAFVATGPTGNLSNNNYGGGGALVIAAPGLTNGEFQTVMRFDLSGALSSFNAQYGAGQWSVQSVSLELTSSPHGNVIYNAVNAGTFNISLMLNNSWVEGTGNASSPTTDGITYSTLLNTYVSENDQNLGTGNFPGGMTGANTYSLNLSPGLVSDILDGSDLSLRLFAADTNVSYLFSSRASSPASTEPQLIVTVIPEPASLALSGFGAVILLWRRNQKAVPSS